MKILVTGGAGFIGSHIVDAYVQQGHNVWIVDNLSTGKKAQINKRAKFIRKDISRSGALTSLFKRVRFDVVNHHAAQIDVRSSVLDPIYDANVNILGTINVLNACRDTKVKKVIFSSSGGTVYGECTAPAKEGSPERPLSPYGIAKFSAEKYIQAYAALYRLKYTIFRYANVYGPRQDPHGEAGVVAIFSNLFLTNKRPLVFGTGRQQRDFVFVKDVAAANVKVLRSGDNQIFNIGTGRAASVIDLIYWMGRLTGHQQQPIHKSARPGELMRNVLSHAKIRSRLGWSPKYSLEEGLKATLTYFADRL